MMMTETVREERTIRVITQISLTDTETGGREDLQVTNLIISSVDQSSPLSLVEQCRGFALIGWILIIVPSMHRKVLLWGALMS